MSTVSSIGQYMAMDGQNYSSVQPATAVETQASDNAAVISTIQKNMEQTRANIQELQEISSQIMDRKLQFSVNQELGSVIVKVLDPKTNKVLKEIPSEDLQKLKINMRRTIGLLFDGMA